MCKEHEFSLDRKHLAKSKTDGNWMMPMKVIDDNDEESDAENIDLIEDEGNNIIVQDDNDDNWLLFYTIL